MSLWKLIFGTKSSEQEATLPEEERERMRADRKHERLTYMMGKDRDPSMMVRFAQENERDSSWVLAKMRRDEDQRRRLGQEEVKIALRLAEAAQRRLDEEVAHQKRLAKSKEILEVAMRGQKQEEPSRPQEGLGMRNERERELKEVQGQPRRQGCELQGPVSKVSEVSFNNDEAKLNAWFEKRTRDRLEAESNVSKPSKGLRR